MAVNAALAFITVVAFLIARFFYVLRWNCGLKKTTSCGSVCTMIVLGSGGHTAEMISLTAKLSSQIYHPRYFVVGTSDSTSIAKYEAVRGSPLPPGSIVAIPRSREVGQSWFTSVLSTVHAIAWAVIHIARLRPALVLCNGPGTTEPSCSLDPYHSLVAL
jgi:beta-1,4-N-acetylglucosaminyltransferase